MIIAALGFYGHGNLGDEMLLESLRAFANPYRVIPISATGQGIHHFVDRLNGYDYIILGGGGLFRNGPPPPFDTFHQWGALLKAPISVLGVGIERLEHELEDATNALIERSDYFIVRDQESAVLTNNAKVLIAPDLTFIRPVSATRRVGLGQDIRCGINLRPHRLGTSEWTEALRNVAYPKVPLPFSVTPTFDDREALLQIVDSCPDEPSLQSYEDLSLVIGTAFHSIVFAIQAGVPCIAINYHPKVRRLMEEVGLEEYVLEWNESESLPQVINQALASAEAISARMLAYRERANAAVMSALAPVRETLDSRAEARPSVTFSLSSLPTATIFIDCRGADESSAGRSLSSCCRQTYSGIDIVALDWNRNGDVSIPCEMQQHLIRYDSAENYDGPASIAASASGDYVTWLTAGSWFAADAIAVLISQLQQKTRTSFASSDYFITVGPNINRIINQRVSDSTSISIACPFLMIRKSEVAKLWEHGIRPSGGIVDLGLLDDEGVFVGQPLFYRPAGEAEILLYRAAVLYGRGMTEEACSRLARAIDLNPNIALSECQFEKEFRAFLHAAFHPSVSIDPAEYFEAVCQSLPDGNRHYALFRRRFIGRSSLELAYIYQKKGDRKQTRAKLLTWLRVHKGRPNNSGALRLLSETLVGDAHTDRLHTAYQRLVSLRGKDS